MIKYHYVLLFLISLIVFSCEKTEPISDDPIVNPSGETDTTIIVTGNENYLNLKSDYIFDQNKLPTFELNLSAAALTKIDNNPTAEEYVVGSLTFEGETVSPVGIRYKGSVGAFVGCVSGTDWSNPSGRKTCPKLSMKIKFNWDDPEVRFYGLKKLQFHAMNLDDSQMRDRLGYWLFRESGVPAPRAIHARLLINGEFIGLFSLVEQIDGRFTRYNFEDGSGNLYKEIWPIDAQGNPHPNWLYLENLKTNEDENPSVEMIRNFASEISNTDSVGIRKVIKTQMNLDEIISYAVVDRTIRVDDGPFHWYCSNDQCSPHNFYWYEEPTAGTLHLIPWDMDNAFENIISNENPVTPIADGWGETRAGCQPFRFGTFGFMQRSAACDKLTAGWASFRDEYERELKEFKNGPLSEARVSAVLSAWEAQIRAATQEARQKYGSDAISVLEWESSVNKLKNQLEFARSN